MIEQPLPAGNDAALADIDRPVPVCADESCHDTATLAGLKGRYDMVNIKLDKTGGLTEALKLKRAAEAEGRSEEHPSELQSLMAHLVCRLLLEKKKYKKHATQIQNNQ